MQHRGLYTVVSCVSQRAGVDGLSCYRGGGGGGAFT